jgi:hypothetical protein
MKSECKNCYLNVLQLQLLFKKLILFYRQKALGGFSELLRTIPGLPKEWITTCRPCSPRVLFLFESCPAIYREDKTNVERTGSGELVIS